MYMPRKWKRKIVKPNSLVAEYNKSPYKVQDFPLKLGKKSLRQHGAAYNVFDPYVNEKNLAIKEEPEDMDLEKEDEDGYVGNLNKLLTAMRREYMDPIHFPSDKQSSGAPR